MHVPYSRTNIASLIAYHSSLRAKYRQGITEAYHAQKQLCEEMQSWRVTQHEWCISLFHCCRWHQGHG